MKRYVHVTKEVREFLMKAFGVGDKTVFNALTFCKERDNDTAKRIRRLAMEKGGIMMVDEVVEDQMLHDHDGYMRQYFSNGALLEINKLTGDATVWFKGEKRMEHCIGITDEIFRLQGFAKGL